MGGDRSGRIPGSGSAHTQIKSVNLRNYMVRGQIIGSYFIVPPKKPRQSETLMLYESSRGTLTL